MTRRDGIVRARDGKNERAAAARGAARPAHNAKAYVLGTKLIKGGQLIDKSKLIDPSIAFKPANLIME